MEEIVRVGVTVTFLRMNAPATEPAPLLPPGTEVVHARECSVAFYRYLYNTIGADYVWWLRRSVSDTHLARILSIVGRADLVRAKRTVFEPGACAMKIGSASVVLKITTCKAWIKNNFPPVHPGGAWPPAPKP